MKTNMRGQNQQPSLTPSQISGAAAKYLEGKSIRHLAIGLGVSAPTLRKWLVREGVELRSPEVANQIKPVRQPDVVLTAEQLATAQSVYGAGESLVVAGESVGVSRTVLAKLFRKGAVPIRQGSEAHRDQGLNVEAFDNAPANPEAAYWVGLLFADGCVRREGGHARISLGLSGEDGDHVRDFAEFVGSSNAVRVEANSGYSRAVNAEAKPVTSIRFSSSRMADALAVYGLTSRKSLTARACGGLERNRHFWRGVVDGDGTVGFAKGNKGRTLYPLIEVCGSLPSMEQFAEYAAAVAGCRAKPRRNGYGDCWKVGTVGSFARRLIAVLYTDSVVALPRKAHLAQMVLAQSEWPTVGSEAAHRSCPSQAFRAFKSTPAD